MNWISAYFTRKVRDDSGAVRPVEAFWQVMEQVVDGRETWRAPWRTVLRTLFTALCCVYIVAMVIWSPRVAALAIGATVVIVPLRLLWERLTARRRLPVDVATLAAHGRCGCCGWGIRDSQPAKDGCVACPECGAAWNRARFTLLSHSRQADEIVLEIVAQHLMRKRTWHEPTDDRGVCLRIEGLTPTREAQRGNGEDLRVEIVNDRVFQSGRTFRWWATVGLLIVWLGAMVTAKLTGPYDQGAFAMRFIFGLVVGVPLLAMVWRVQLPWFVRRRSVLGLGVCPQCLDEIKPANAGFDGCVPCEVCGRAWNAKDIGSLAEFPSLKVPCRGCGNDRGGLEACPECGMRTDGTFVPGTGHPVCARCGTDLSGENRACPKCGMMAGVEYV